MKICPRCGYTSVLDDARFCPECGMMVGPEEVKAPINMEIKEESGNETDNKQETSGNIYEANDSSVEETAATTHEAGANDTQVMSGVEAEDKTGNTQGPSANASGNTGYNTQGMASNFGQTSYNNVPPKKKNYVPLIVCIVIGAIIALLAIVGVVAFIRKSITDTSTNKNPTTSSETIERNIYYDAYGIYEYLPSEETSYQITKLDSNYGDLGINIADNVYITANGKYAAFIKDYEMDAVSGMVSGTLYYTDLDEDIEKRTDERIADHVQSINMLSDNTLIYFDSNETMFKCKFDDETGEYDKRRVGTSTSDYRVSTDGTTLFWYNQAGSAYVLKSGDEKETRVAKDVYYLEYASRDLKQIYYTTYEYDLKYIADGADAKLIDTDVYSVYPIEKTGKIYYSKNGDYLKLKDYVIDRTAVTAATIDSDTPSEEEAATETTGEELTQEETTTETSSEDVTTEISTELESENVAETLSDEEYEYLKQMYEEYGMDEYYTSFDEFYEEYLNYDNYTDYGDDYTDYDYSEFDDVESWMDYLDQATLDTTAMELYYCDGENKTKVADNVLSVQGIGDSIRLNRIIYTSFDADAIEKTTITEIPTSSYDVISEVETEINSKRKLYIAMEDKSIDTNIENDHNIDDIYTLVHDILDNTFYYTIYDSGDYSVYDDYSDYSDYGDYGYYDDYGDYGDYGYYGDYNDYKTTLYKVDYDDTGAKESVEMQDDIGTVIAAVGGRYLSFYYGDNYTSDVADFYVNGSKVATGVYTVIYDDEKANTAIDFMENTYVESDDYYSTGTVLGNVSRYDGNQTTEIIQSVSEMEAYQDGHYEFLCDYDTLQNEGAFYYWNGESDTEPVMVAEDVAGIRSGDISD